MAGEMISNIFNSILGQLKKLQVPKIVTPRKLLAPKFLAILVGGGLGAATIGIGAYAVLDYTESANFCGQVCHAPMNPEYTVYQASVHSTVPCAKCHVGAGTLNLIKSKINGVGQIFSSVSGTYPHPITSPVDNLRPATETCEQCHTPSKFSGEQVKTVASYASDLANTKQSYTLVLKVGGGESGVAGGIHWHITSKLWYVPMDNERLQIGWVGVDKGDGVIKQYVNPSDASALTPEYIQKNKRLMDCVDCHNRTGHDFLPPDELINQALQSGNIDPTLPFIKKEALNAIGSVSTIQQADLNADSLRQYYQLNYPGVYDTKLTKIDQAIASLKEIAALSIFPDMNVNSGTHVDNSGHNKPSDTALSGLNLNFDGWKTNRSDGCFRCHGTVVPSDAGSGSATFVSANPPDSSLHAQPSKTLDASCNLCHYSSTNLTGAPIPKDIPHPTDRLENCTLCHGPTSLKPFPVDHPWSTNEACMTCHKEAQVFKTVAAAVRPTKAKDLPHLTVGLEDCFLCHGDTAAKPMSASHPWSSTETCLSCHPLSSKPLPVPLADPVPATVPKVSHVIEGLQDCLLCHVQGGPKPINNNHPWSTNETCLACHAITSAPAASKAGPVKPAPAILHPVEGLANCTQCHPSAYTFPDNHAGVPNNFCQLCHQTGPITQLTSVPSIGPQIQHSLAGLGNCLGCHDTGRQFAFSSDHAGRPTSMCLICHQINPNATTPSPAPPSGPPPSGGGGGGGGGSAPPTTPPPTGTATAAQLYASNCAACHGANLQGASAPPINATALAGQTRTQVSAKLATGSMSAYTNSMTSAQISSMVDYLLGTSSASPTVISAAATAITSSGVTLNGSLSSLGSSASASLSFQYGTTASYGTTVAAIPPTLSAAGGFTATIAGLSPNTIYHFTAVATGSGTASGNDMTFTTAAGPLTVATGAASGIAATAATLNGNLISLGTAASVTVSFDYGATTTYGSSAAGVPASLSAPGAFSANLTGLTSGRTYHFRAKAVAGANTVYGNDQQFTATAATAPVVATNPASAIAATGATLNGSLSSLGGGTSVTVSFQYGTSTSYGSTAAGVPPTLNAAGAFTANLTGLTAGTTYHYRAVAVGSSTVYGADQTFATTAATFDPATWYATSQCTGCHNSNRQGSPNITSTGLAGRTLAQVTAKLSAGGSMNRYVGTLNATQIAALANWLKITP
jgi:mono/diheme cytochrome c family protein